VSSNGDSSICQAHRRVSGREGFGAYLDESLGGAGVVGVAGELDVATADLLDDVLSLASVMPGDRLIVDVSRLTFVDAAGIRVLVTATNALTAAGGGDIVIRGASGMVRRVIGLTGLDELLDDRPPEVAGCDVAADGKGRGALELARRDAGLSVKDLFIAYFALGGAADRGQLVDYLAGDAGALDRHQRDIAVHAVNEHLEDVGRTDRLLSYASA
jgi:anti-sigma B factor antagonist